MEVPGEGGAPGEAVRAVDDTFILPYFLEEVQRQDLHSPSPLKSTYNRERRTLRPSTLNSFVGGICRPQERPLAAAVERRRITSATHSLGNGGAASGGTRGTVKHAEWLRATLESALKSSDTLPLLNHLRALTSRVFSEDTPFKTQASITAKISLHQAQMGAPQLMQSLSAEEVVRLACRLAQENSYLETFVSTDSRVLQSAALVTAQRERAEALESNRRLLQQAERDRQVIVELEMRSRAFADAYAWLTSHSRRIHAKDAPALVALWRKRVAGAAVAGKGPVVPDFSKNLAEAYVAADSEEDTEPSSEDGDEKKKREDRLIAAELREAEAVSEARQAQARASMAEARAAAAEQELSVARSQLARLTSAAASSAAAAAAATAIPSPPTSRGGGIQEQLQAALRDSEERAAAAENECAQLKKTLETLQASLDISVSEQHRLEHELAVAVGGAEAKLAAEIERHAAERAQLQAQHSEEVEKLKASVHEAAKLRRELEETRQRCADLSAQLAGASQKGIGEGLTKAAFPGGLASPSASDISTLTSERDSYKATALRLEMEIKRLSARAAEAAQLAEAVAALEGKLKAGEELKRAYETLQKEAQTLRSQLSERRRSPAALNGPAAFNKQTDSTTMERDTLRREVEALQEQLAKLREEAKSVKTLETAPQVPSATGRDDSSNTETKRTAAEVEELIKERNSLQERVRALEAEVVALRGASSNPGKVLPATKSIPSPTPSSPASQPSPSKTPPAASPKGRGISVPVEKTQSAFPAVTGEGDTVVQPSRAIGSCVGKVPHGLEPPKVPKGLLTAVPSPEGAPSALPEAKTPTKAPLPKKAGPPEGVKVLPAATPKIVAKTPTAVPSSEQRPQPPKWDAEAARLKNAGPVVSKPLPTSPVQEAETVPHAALSPEHADTSGEASLKERQAAATARGDAAVVLSKAQGPSLGKKVASPLLSKSGKAYPAQDLNAAGTPLNSNPASSKTSDPPVSKMSHGAALPVQDTKTTPTDSAISGGDEASPSPSAAALPHDTAAVKFSAASADGAKNAGVALPKTLAKATKVPAPPKKAPPVESPTLVEEIFSEEAKQKLEKEVAELREQLAARDELKKAYETLQKENENLQSKLKAVGALGKQAAPSSTGDKSSEEHEMAVSDSHADYAAVAKERDRLADRVKALENELAILRDSQKAALANKAPPDRKLQGSTAVPVCKESGRSSGGPLGKAQAQLAKGLEEEASAHVGEDTAAQERAKLGALEREVVTLRQQVADGQKIKEDYAALVEEVKQLQSENDAFKMQAKGPKASPVKDVGENISEETTLTAAKVAELVKERDSLQDRVRDLEEELAAFRFTPVSPVKATLASKNLSSPTSSAPPLQPLLSKKPPAPSSKLGKTAAVSFTTVHSESTPGGAGTCGASSGAAEPPVVLPGPKPSVLKPGEVVAKAYSPDIASEPKAEAASPAKAVFAVSQKVPGSLFSKAMTTPAAATPAGGATAAKGDKAKLTVAAAKTLETKKSSGTLPKKSLSPKGPPLASCEDGSGSAAKVEASPASSKTSDPPVSKMSHGAALPVQDTKTTPTDSAISGGDEASPSPSAAALPHDTAAVKFSAASADGEKNAGVALPKTLAKATKVPAPPKKAPPVESPTLVEEIFSEEAKQKLEKEVAELREQLAARDELKKAYETLQKENENLQSKLKAVGALGKQAAPSSADDKSSEKIGKAASDGKQAEVIAALEAQLSVLRPKAAAAEELEKDIKRLQGQLSAKEDLRKAHEALKKEAETLKQQLSELKSKARLPAEPVKPTAPGKGRSLGAGELEDALRKRSELRERVRGLEKEVSAVSGSSTKNATVPSTAKEAVASSDRRGSRSTKKPPPPPLKKEQAASAKPAVEALQAGDNVGLAQTDDAVKEVSSKAAGVLLPVAGEAGGRETGATEMAVRGKCQQQTNGKPSVGKALMDLTSSKEPSTGEKAEVAGGPVEGLPKGAKLPMPTPKPAEKATKVPPPPKKAPPVGATPIDGSELTVEAKGNLEKEIARLRVQLEASEELKRTHEALQKEFEALQGEFKALKAQAAAGIAEGNAETAEVANSELHKIHLLLEERNSLRERVAELESDLSALRAAELQGVAVPTHEVSIPKTKGKLPPKVKPGMPPLPAKPAKQTNATAMEAQTADPTGHISDESHRNLAGAEPAQEDIVGEAKPRSPPMKGTAGEGHQNKASLLTEEVLSKSDAETEEGDSGTETSSAEERIAELTERLHRAKRRVRNLVVKCNALVEMEKEREALRSRLESLQAKHEAISKLHGKEGGYTPAEPQAEKLEGVNTLSKAASASALPASTFASTVADDVEGLSTVESGLATQSSSALLDVRPPADWAAKYEKLKAQRDKVYQAYKAQKERINSLEEEEAATKEKLERVERLYRETQEELEIATNPPKQREGAEPTGLLSWLGGGTHDEKNPEEQKLRARLELLQQRLQKAQAENEVLSNKLAQMRTTPTGSPRGDKASGGKAATDESQKRGSQHLSPDATAKETGSAVSSAKTPSSTPPGPIREEDSEGGRKSLEEMKMQIKQKDSQIEEYKAEILKLKASVVPASGTISVAPELAKKEQELQVKAAELEKFRNEALKMETLIKEKTEEVKTLQAKLEVLEREKLQALSDNSALKKELETVQQELDALKAERSAPAPAKDRPKLRTSADPTSAPTKTFKRSSSLAKRTPGLPPPAPASRGDNLYTAAGDANEAREEEAQSVSSQPIQKVVANPTGDQQGRHEERSEVQDGKEDPSNNEGSEAETVSKRKPKKASGEADGEPKSRKAQKEDNEGIKKKKKKKKKVEVSGETSAQHSGAESIADHEDVAGAAAAASSTPAWGFGLFGTGEGTPDASKKDATAKEATSSGPRPSILGLIVGANPAEETPKEDEVPPLKLSTVDGTDDQSDSSSSDDGETDGGIASTIAGFFWGV